MSKRKYIKPHPLYETWKGMRRRCYDTNFVSYPHYGGRGIRVCHLWKKSFLAFVEDMGQRPAGHTLGRLDNDGDYSPKNCRWEDRHTQDRNKGNNRFLTLNGETKILSDWAAEAGIDQETFRDRANSGLISAKDLFRPTRTITKTRWSDIKRFVERGGSVREAARVFKASRNTVRKIVQGSPCTGG